MKHILQKVTWS